MGALELTAAAFGLASVWLTVRQHIWCWPTGLVMVVLYIVVFHEAKLYSDMWLQVIYVGLQIYGWHHWLHGGAERDELPVTSIPRPAFAGWALLSGLGTYGLGWYMSHHTDAALPYWDAATTVLSLIAQWLMAKKVLECWLFWITVDVLCVGVYTVKHLLPTTVLYAVFLVLASIGWAAWRRSYLAPAAA